MRYSIIRERGGTGMPTLEWIGKSKVVNHHLEVPYQVLERKYSYDEKGQHDADNGSQNMIIHGDNLAALKSLLPQYEGRIQCIYLDPPYNTGNEGWVYNDNVNDPRIKKWLGEVVGKEGEDLSRHDKWLCMMYPRLKLLQRLLADDGAVFISIDDNEQANLKLICDEIFGANNFVAMFIWQKRTSPDMRKRVSTAHEYILTYVRNISLLDKIFNLAPLDESDKKKYSNPDNDPRGPWASSDFTAQGYRPNQMYTIVTPGGKEYSPTPGHCWKNVESEYLRQVKEGRIWFGKDGNSMPRRKTYMSERKGKNVWTWWDNKSVGHTQEATQELTKIFRNKTIFDYPKPVRLIKRVLEIAAKKESIILDSFAGSGTTAHAVLNLNKQDGGHRKFILIEMMDYADSITAERVKRVIQGYGEGKNQVEGTGGDFSFYELGKPIFKGEFLNEAIGLNEIRKYMYFTETRQPLPSDSAEEPAYLGTWMDVAYYFHYEPLKATTLNWDFLATIKIRAEAYVIYADTCALSEKELLDYHITFKKIPRDIVRF